MKNLDQLYDNLQRLESNKIYLNESKRSYVSPSMKHQLTDGIRVFSTLNMSAEQAKVRNEVLMQTGSASFWRAMNDPNAVL